MNKLEKYKVKELQINEIQIINGGWLSGWVNRILEDWLGNEQQPPNGE